MDKFSLTILKKQLSQKSKEELIKEIATLCKTFPQVKEYYKAQTGDIQQIIDKYKEIIKKEFIAKSPRTPAPKARFSVARKALNDVKKLTNDPEIIADVMLTYVASVSHFNTEWGPDVEDFYTRPEDLFEQALALIKKHDLLDKFQGKAYDIVQNATEKWGHQESLEERYQEVYGDLLE